MSSVASRSSRIRPHERRLGGGQRAGATPPRAQARRRGSAQALRAANLRRGAAAEADDAAGAGERDARLATTSSRNLRWALLVFVAGAALMLGFFTSQTLVALGGFAAMVVAVVWIVAILRRRAGVSAASPESLAGRLRRRFRND